MKKNILSFFVAMSISIAAVAQLEPGEVLVGGSFNVSFKTYKPRLGNDASTTNVGITPVVLFGLSKNFALGGLLSYESEKYKYKSVIYSYYNGYPYAGISNDHVEKTDLFGIALLGRPCGKLDEKAYCYGDIQAGVAFGKYKEDSNPALDLFEFSFIMTPGIAYNVKKKVQLTFNYGMLGFIASSVKPPGSNSGAADESTSFGINLDGSTLRIGAYFRL